MSRPVEPPTLVEQIAWLDHTLDFRRRCHRSWVAVNLDTYGDLRELQTMEAIKESLFRLEGLME